MDSKVFYLLFIFIVYSIIGWIGESLIVSIKNKRFINRGVLTGPFVITYGFAMLINSIAFFDETNIILVFLGTMLYTTFAQLTSGKMLLMFKLGRWWDYSKKKFNLEGLISLDTSIIFAALSTFALLVINPLINKLYNLINYDISKIIIISILIIMIIDFIISYIILTKDNKKVIKSKKNSISNDVIDRVKMAYPSTNKKGTFAEDSFNVYKFFLYIFLGGVFGCGFETIYCRITMHQWMSRSSLLYGEISLVWGVAFALMTTYLHMYRKRSNLFMFLYGLLIGTGYEYICGSFNEYVFGYSFWDYRHLPLNINGRVQIIFALFWGFASLVYIKFFYKHLNKWIEKIPEKIGKIVVSTLVSVLLLDIVITVVAGMRFNERDKGLPPSNIVDEFCDKYYTDEYMTNRFKTLKMTGN